MAPHAPGRGTPTQRPADDVVRTHVEVHDRTQVEIRFRYALGSGGGEERSTLDAYFFIPRNVGINRDNFSREQFYGDFTALMRLDAPPLPLEALSDPLHPDSPLFRLTRALDRLRTSPRPPPSRALVVHVRLYAYLFSQSVREVMRDASHRAQGAVGSPARQESALAHLHADLGRLQHALDAFREIRGGYWPFEKICHGSVAESLRSADEHMSVDLEERLASFVESVGADPRHRDGSGFAARVRATCAELATRESAYRAHRGYLVLREGADEGEYFTFRQGQLKKAVQQALYLDPRAAPVDKFLRNAVGAVGAALAAIWALATQLPATLAEVPSTTKVYFFTAAVLAYVLKDRIKAVTNDYLSARLRTSDHSWTLAGHTLADVGLGGITGRMTESMRFLRSAEVPPSIFSLRLRRRTVQLGEPPVEEVIHYRKTMRTRTPVEREGLATGYWVRDTLRFNVRHFLVRLDDPIDQVAYFDRQSGGFASLGLPKVYHLNLVLHATRSCEGGRSEERLEHLRIVLNKDGVVRVEQVERLTPPPIQTPRRRRWTLRGWWTERRSP